MWEAIQRLWDIIQNPDQRAVISWIGGGIVVVGGGIWTVVKFFAERKKPDEKNGGGTKVIQSGLGHVSGRDTNFLGPVTIELSTKPIVQIQKPSFDRLDKNNSQNKTVANLLRQKHLSPAPVGAAGCDGGLHEALALLKTNEDAAALRLLSFAEHRTARITKDRKEAAIAYRNLGAIARLHDPKLALEFYEQALTHDPDDLESLYWAGSMQIEHGGLNKAQTRLERVLMLGRTEDQAYHE